MKKAFLTFMLISNFQFLAKAQKSAANELPSTFIVDCRNSSLEICLDKKIKYTLYCSTSTKVDEEPSLTYDNEYRLENYYSYIIKTQLVIKQLDGKEAWQYSKLFEREKKSILFKMDDASSSKFAGEEKNKAEEQLNNECLSFLSAFIESENAK